jgi:hypothetical protein
MSNSALPFSIRIFLPDGRPDGVRIIEKSNWTGIGLVIPRSLLAEEKFRDECCRTGVYVLVGQDEQSELPTISAWATRSGPALSAILATGTFGPGLFSSSRAITA